MILASVAHPRLSTNSMLLLSIPSRATSSLKNRLFSFTIYDNCLRMIWNKIATSTHNWWCTWQTCHRVCPHPEFQIWLQEDLLPVMKYNFDLCLKWNISGYGMGGSQMQPYSFISLYSPLFLFICFQDVYLENVFMRHTHSVGERLECFFLPPCS